MIYMGVMALLFSRANLDLHESKNSHKKSSKASLQVIKNPRFKRLEIEEGRSKLCRERRSAGHQKELWSSHSQGQGPVTAPAPAPPPETNVQLRPGEGRTDYSDSDNDGGTDLTNDR